MKYYIFIGIFCVVFGGLVILSGNAKAIANPASVYCIQLGGMNQIVTDSSGAQTGLCHLPGNVICNEWDLYRGSCSGWPPASSGVVYDERGVLLRDGDLISASFHDDPNIFIIKFSPHGDLLGYKRLFLNPVIFSFYGHLGGFSRVHPVSIAVRDRFETSGLFRNCETDNQTVWATEVTEEDAATFHHVAMSGNQAASEDTQFFAKVFCINTREEQWYPKSIYPYNHLSQIPPYTRKICPPRPACLDSTPPCYLAEPVSGWCVTPTPTPPPGCYYQQIQCIRAPCNPVLVCPTPSPTPTPIVQSTPTITSVNVHVSVNNPQIMAADIAGYLPTPCHTLQTSTLTQSGNAIYLSLPAQATSSANCIQVLQPFTKTVDLHAGPIMPIGTYTLYINGQYWTSFTKVTPTPTPTPSPISMQVTRTDCAIIPACATLTGSCSYQILPAGMNFCPAPQAQPTAVGMVNSSVSQSGNIVTLSVNLTTPSCYRFSGANMTWQNSAVNLVPDIQFDSSYCGSSVPVTLTYIFTAQSLSPGIHYIYTNGYTNSLGQFTAY